MFLALTFNVRAEFLETIKTVCPIFDVESLPENFKELYQNSVQNLSNKIKLKLENDDNGSITEKTQLPYNYPPKNEDEPLGNMMLSLIYFTEKIGKDGKPINSDKINNNLNKTLKLNLKYGFGQTDFGKYFVSFLYCFRLPGLVIPNEKGVENIQEIREHKIFYVMEAPTQTMAVTLKRGYVNPEKRIIISVLNRLKIVRHVIMGTQYLKKIGMKVCRFRIFNFTFIPVQKREEVVFTALHPHTQKYVKYKLNQFITDDLIPVEQPCIENKPFYKYSPEAFNPKNIEDKLYEKGQIFDEFAGEFSLAIFMLGFEYLYRIAPVDITEVLLCFSKQYFTKKDSDKASMYDIYWDYCGDKFNGYADVLEKTEDYLSWNVNRLQMYQHMKKFKQLRPSEIADKETFFDSFISQNIEYDKEERYIGYHFMTHMLFKIYLNLIKKTSYQSIDKWHNNFEAELIDFYELIYPRSPLTIPKNPRYIFDEKTVNQLTDFIISIKFSDQLLGIYYDTVALAYKNYVNPKTNVTLYLETIDKAIEKHDQALRFLLREFSEIKTRYLVDIVFQVRNGKIFIRGYEALKVILLTNKKIKTQGMLLA